MIVPMVNAIYLSFTSSTALSVGFNSKFVFLDNYKYMFQDKDFLQALFNTLKLMLVIPAVTIFLSLVFAFILTQGQLKEKSFYRTVFFFPSIVSMTVVGIVWSFVFNPTRGILNHMLDLFHLSTWKHAWLGEGKTALWCIGAALVWQDLAGALLKTARCRAASAARCTSAVWWVLNGAVPSPDAVHLPQ